MGYQVFIKKKHDLPACPGVPRVYLLPSMIQHYTRILLINKTTMFLTIREFIAYVQTNTVIRTPLLYFSCYICHTQIAYVITMSIA